LVFLPKYFTQSLLFFRDKPRSTAAQFYRQMRIHACTHAAGKCFHHTHNVYQIHPQDGIIAVNEWSATSSAST
jgi:hypothetical protein